MKECPICGARCFDDMEVCYGCLHHFAQENEGEKSIQKEMAEALESSKMLQQFSFGGSVEEKDRVCVAADKSPLVNKVVPDSPAVNVATPVNVAAPVKVADDEVASGSKTAKNICGEADCRGDFGGSGNRADSEETYSHNSGEEWVVRVGVPAGCDGVTIRLERTNQAS